jgi:hypothetical protein
MAWNNPPAEAKPLDDTAPDLQAPTDPDMWVKEGEVGFIFSTEGDQGRDCWRTVRGKIGHLSEDEKDRVRKTEMMLEGFVALFMADRHDVLQNLINLASMTRMAREIENEDKQDEMIKSASTVVFGDYDLDTSHKVANSLMAMNALGHIGGPELQRAVMAMIGDDDDVPDQA